MRVIKTEKNVCTFEELPETSKQKAFEKWIENHEYIWSRDNENTLKAFTGIFPITATGYEYGCRNFINYKLDSIENESDVLKFTGVRLYKWIVNNFWHVLYNPAYKGCIHKHTSHKRTKNQTAKSTNNEYSMYYSAIFYDSCGVLTGYCVDDAILQPIYDFLKNPEKNTTLEDLLYECLQSWVYACNRDYEYAFSYESFMDDVSAYGYEFHENGDIA